MFPSASRWTAANCILLSLVSPTGAFTSTSTNIKRMEMRMKNYITVRPIAFQSTWLILGIFTSSLVCCSRVLFQRDRVSAQSSVSFVRRETPFASCQFGMKVVGIQSVSRIRVPAVMSMAPPSSAVRTLEPDLKPDPSADGFSLRNAYFLSEMNQLVFSEKAEVERVVKGELGYPHFLWFELDPEVSEASRFDSIEDTEGFVAADDEVIFVVFRGTNERSDISTDIKVNLVPAPSRWGVKGSLHQGFLQGVTSVWERKSVVQTVRRLYNEPGKDRRVFVTGQSLGAALATVAVGYLAFEENIDVHGFYTTGSPRVFDKELAAIFNGHKNGNSDLRSKSFRIRNNNDLVTRVPFPLYRHIGQEVYFDRTGVISTYSFVDRVLGRLDAVLDGNLLDSIDDHSTATYTMLLRNAFEESQKSKGEKWRGIVSKIF